jgi:beta-glucosidase
MPRADELPLRDQVRLLSGASHWHTRALPGVRAVKLADGPHGLRVQPDAEDHLGLGASEPATCFPPAVTLASTWDEELATAYGAALGAEAAAQGVDVVLGPGLNIKRHPLCGRNFEYLSEDPLLAGHLAAAMVRGSRVGASGRA